MPKSRTRTKAERTAPVALLLSVLLACATWDVFRIRFFADDLHFLDVARRFSLPELLGGQHGIWPWYRPLSRELLFWILVHAGPFALVLAHVLSVAVLGAAAWALWRLARRVTGDSTAAVVAPVLFVTYAFTKFLTAWASGFQDLLAIALTLWAVWLHVAGRTRVAIVLAALAPFAKETGFIAGPLLIAWSILCERERRVRVWMVVLAALLVAAVAVHAWVRMHWTAGGTGAEIHAFQNFGNGLAGVFRAFVSIPGPVTLTALGLAGVAGLSTWYASRPLRLASAGATPAPRAMALFLGLASLAGFGPMLVGSAFALTIPYAYHAFPAVPWLALAAARLARRIPLAALRPGVALLAALNVWGLAWQPVRTSDPSFWDFGEWDWHEAIRLSDVSEFLSADLRRAVPDPPHGLVVMYAALPSGSLFQTEDGPATREALRDTSVRAYFANQVPLFVTRGRFVILSFGDPGLHFNSDPGPLATVVQSAATALAVGRTFTAYAWASDVDSTLLRRFDLAYLRAGSRLQVDGPNAFVRELADADHVDSLSGSIDADALAMVGGDPGLARAYAGVLRHPMTAAPHAALAESLLARGILVDAAVALRVASALEPTRLSDRLKLAELLAGLGETAAARTEFEAIAARTGDPTLAATARERLSQLRLR
jgi:hypothetical protein